MIPSPIFTAVDPLTEDPRVIRVVVEIPRGKRTKFEVDKTTGLIKMDRYLYSSSHYPGDYGFVPQTLAEDGDPLDALIKVSEPTFSGCLIEARIIGIFRMIDRGAADKKILAVPYSDPLFDEYQSLTDVPHSFLREVSHFFETYKQLEGVTVETQGWGDAEEAVNEVQASIERYRQAGKAAS